MSSAGQAINNSDLSILKLIALGKDGRIGLQIRGEFLNAFNHTAFGLPNMDPYSLAFGQVTATAAYPRQVQLNAKLTF